MNNFAEYVIFVTILNPKDNREHTVVYYAADRERAEALVTTLRHHGKMLAVNKQSCLEEVPIRFVHWGHL